MGAALTTRRSRRSGPAEDQARPAEGRSRRTGGGTGPATSIRNAGGAFTNRTQREISNLKKQLHQAKENIAKERVERCSKSKKDDIHDEEVGSRTRRFRQQAKRARASRPGSSPPSPPRRGFKMLPTGDNSDSEEEDDYPQSNARATYAKAKFARIQPIIQKKTSRMDVEPGPTRTRVGQVVTSTHQRLIDLAINSLQEPGMTTVVCQCPTWRPTTMIRKV
jgi:hypothetical protein